MELKQVILIRQDLKLPKGKLAVQVAHASVQGVFNSESDIVDEWREQGMKKVALKVKDEKELLDFMRKAKAAKLKTALIEDAGKTVVAPGTKTCLAIGPDEESRIDILTGKLKMV